MGDIHDLRFRCVSTVGITLVMIFTGVGCGYTPGGAANDKNDKNDTPATASKPVDKRWQRLLDHQLPSVGKAEMMINLDMDIETPTETLGEKFHEFTLQLQMRTGKKLPVELAPEVSERVVEGWSGTGKNPFNKLLPTQSLTVGEFLEYVADDLALNMEITEGAILFTAREVRLRP